MEKFMSHDAMEWHNKRIAEKDARIAELEHQLDIRKAAIEAQFRLMKQLEDARVLMRDLWRLDPSELPSEELAQRCKAFMGGG